jgi:hypothetical protein
VKAGSFMVVAGYLGVVLSLGWPGVVAVAAHIALLLACLPGR